MKNLLFLFATFLCLFVAAFAAADCEFKGKSLKVGESYTPTGECSQTLCTAPGKLTSKTCPTVAKTCKSTKGDPSKPFPDCCPKQDCAEKP